MNNPGEGFGNGVKIMKEQVPVDYRSFSLIRGGLFFRSFVRMRILKPRLRPLSAWAIFVALLMWLPLLVLSAMQGQALGDSVRVPFLYDIAVASRLLLALPLLIVAERMINSRSNEAIRHFIESGLVVKQDVPRYDAIVRQVSKMMNALPIDIVIAALVILAGSFLNLEPSGTSSNWQHSASPAGMTRTAAGWWYFVVCKPVFQFFLLRRIYRYLVWCWFLWRVSRLKLLIIATHMDRTGGLAFLGVLQIKFCPIIFALSSVIAGFVAQGVLIGGAPLQDYYVTIVGSVLLLLIFFMGPYLVFSLRLLAAKRRGFLEYSMLSSRYTMGFHRKWIKGEAPEGESLLGSSDIQSLADLSNSFSIVREMRTVPYNLKMTVAPYVACAVIPFLPLVFIVFGVNDIIVRILGIIM
jgi:hypothetical protein